MNRCQAGPSDSTVHQSDRTVTHPAPGNTAKQQKKKKEKAIKSTIAPDKVKKSTGNKQVKDEDEDEDEDKDKDKNNAIIISESESSLQSEPIIEPKNNHEGAVAVEVAVEDEDKGSIDWNVVDGGCAVVLR